MTDPALIQQAIPVAHHAKHAAVEAAPVIFQGFSMLTLLLSNLVTAIVFGVGAWYVRGRGMAGVQIDLNNVKSDVENLKAKLSSTSVVA